MGLTRRVACMLGVSARGPDGRPRHPAAVSRARWRLRIALACLAIAALLPLFVVTPGSRERAPASSPQVAEPRTPPPDVGAAGSGTLPATSPALEALPDPDPNDGVMPSLEAPEIEDRATEARRPVPGRSEGDDPALAYRTAPGSSPTAAVSPDTTVEPGGRPQAVAPSLSPRPAPRPTGQSAAAAPRAVGRGASIAIIIDDIGPARSLSARAVALPGPLTMSFLPYAEGLPPLIAAARTRGHQIFLHMPMQPVGEERPGPNALLASMTTEELREHLGWAIARVPGAVGMNNHMGSRLTTDERAMRTVMDVLDQRGLVFIDSRTSPRSIAAAIAAEAGLPHGSRDIFLDHLPTAAFVRRQLAEIEAMARRSGSAIAIGHPLPVTLAVLEAWIPDAKARGFTFVPVTSAIEKRGCDGRSPAGRCGMLLSARAAAAGG